MGLITVNLENFERVLSVKTKGVQLSTKGDYVAAYPDVFHDAVGTLEGEVHLTVDPSISPVAMPARNLPISLRSKVKTELDRLLRLGVISPIDEPTEWVNQIVVVEQKDSDKVRICIDPKPLNKALQ